jgi:hypothetical protein
VAVLLCVLLLPAADAAALKGLTVARIRAILKSLRHAGGVWDLWRRNTDRTGQTRHLKRKKNL